MARARTLKLGFFTNDELGTLPPTTRLLFAGLWEIADREGRLLDRPRRIKAEVLPYDDVDPEEALQQLHNLGFIQRYQADGAALIQVTKWRKHQNPHPNEAPSDLPGPADPPLTSDSRASNEPLTEDSGRSPVSGLRSPVSGPLAFPSFPSGTGTRAADDAPSAPAGSNDDPGGVDGDDDAELAVDPDVAAFVDARSYGFNDNDPRRTMLALQRIWINSGLGRDEFFALAEEAVNRTKELLMTGSLGRDPQGRQKGWPICQKILRELLAEHPTARVRRGRANGARAGPAVAD